MAWDTSIGSMTELLWVVLVCADASEADHRIPEVQRDERGSFNFRLRPQLIGAPRWSTYQNRTSGHPTSVFCKTNIFRQVWLPFYWLLAVFLHFTACIVRRRTPGDSIACRPFGS